jgi:hypothetical protein
MPVAAVIDPQSLAPRQRPTAGHREKPSYAEVVSSLAPRVRAHRFIVGSSRVRVRTSYGWLSLDRARSRAFAMISIGHASSGIGESRFQIISHPHISIA